MHAPVLAEGRPLMPINSSDKAPIQAPSEAVPAQPEDSLTDCEVTKAALIGMANNTDP